jgi:hypothetical protein
MQPAPTRSSTAATVPTIPAPGMHGYALCAVSLRCRPSNGPMSSSGGDGADLRYLPL